jgi:ABC-2 type transport system permease protein
VLWYKYWLETRFLALFMVSYAMFPVALFALTPRPINAPQGSVATAQGAVGFFAVYYSMIPVLLAGSGIKAQAGPRMTKGLYGSTYFTLSLPVSRFRLIATRAGTGMLETVGIFAIAPCAVWIMFPPLRAHITGSDLLLFWVTLFMCGSAIYIFGVLLSTILEDSWRGFASMFGVVFFQWLLSTRSLPPSINIFRAMGASSPLFTHTLPWASIGISLGTSAVLFMVAARVVQVREY